MPAKKPPSLLIVDDDALIRSTLSFALSQDFTIIEAADRAQALQGVQAHGEIELALLDLGLPPHPHRADEGLALIGELLALSPLCKIIVLSGQDEEAHARHARTLGALEFIAKPARPDLLREALKRALNLQLQEREEQRQTKALQRLIGQHPLLQSVRSELQSCADTPFPVLIEGESGTGKEIAALALHEQGIRRDKPFIALNCAAISPGLIEATLFGHSRGAFTGATASQAGYFEEADQGSLFLDEIGELPLELQPKLLRVLESGEYQRLGETQRRHTRTRVIAATNRDLRDEVRNGRFRPDLYHRLSVLRIYMPPLRKLGEDRIHLFEHYLQDFCRQMKLPACRLDPQAYMLWLQYDFPGNVRELRNIIARLLSRHAGCEISRSELEAQLELDTPPTQPPEIVNDSPNDEDAILAQLSACGGVSLDEVLRRVERDYIAAALRAARGNMAQAARLLGLNRSTLYNRVETLSRYGEKLFSDPDPKQG